MDLSKRIVREIMTDLASHFDDLVLSMIHQCRHFPPFFLSINAVLALSGRVPSLQGSGEERCLRMLFRYERWVILHCTFSKCAEDISGHEQAEDMVDFQRIKFYKYMPFLCCDQHQACWMDVNCLLVWPPCISAKPKGIMEQRIYTHWETRWDNECNVITVCVFLYLYVLLTPGSGPRWPGDRWRCWWCQCTGSEQQRCTLLGLAPASCCLGEAECRQPGTMER